MDSKEDLVELEPSVCWLPAVPLHSQVAHICSDKMGSGCERLNGSMVLVEICLGNLKNLMRCHFCACIQ